jgi:cbb3-type cytochrome oxidase subunit 1
MKSLFRFAVYFLVLVCAYTLTDVLFSPDKNYLEVDWNFNLGLAFVVSWVWVLIRNN